jgi:hypothetical protein
MFIIGADEELIAFSQLETAIHDFEVDALS